MRLGDLVRVNKTCDAGGLWGEVGIITEFPAPILNAKLVRVLIGRRLRLLRQTAVDIYPAREEGV
jgi:hypothetical protein